MDMGRNTYISILPLFYVYRKEIVMEPEPMIHSGEIWGEWIFDLGIPGLMVIAVGIIVILAIAANRDPKKKNVKEEEEDA
jgi:hypothetical protein